jgi:hypothetical protein
MLVAVSALLSRQYIALRKRSIYYMLLKNKLAERGGFDTTFRFLTLQVADFRLPRLPRSPYLPGLLCPYLPNDTALKKDLCVQGVHAVKFTGRRKVHHY